MSQRIDLRDPVRRHAAASAAAIRPATPHWWRTTTALAMTIVAVAVWLLPWWRLGPGDGVVLAWAPGPWPTGAAGWVVLVLLVPIAASGVLAAVGWMRRSDVGLRRWSSAAHRCATWAMPGVLLLGLVAPALVLARLRPGLDFVPLAGTWALVALVLLAIAHRLALADEPAARPVGRLPLIAVAVACAVTVLPWVVATLAPPMTDALAIVVVNLPWLALGVAMVLFAFAPLALIGLRAWPLTDRWRVGSCWLALRVVALALVVVAGAVQVTATIAPGWASSPVMLWSLVAVLGLSVLTPSVRGDLTRGLPA